MTGAPPTVEFFSIYTDAPLPAPASADLMGAMPVRAAQFCVPLKAASGLGFYVSPPTDVGVRWDGQRSDVSWLDARGRTTEWLPLDGGTDIHLPDSAGVPAEWPEDVWREFVTTRAPRHLNESRGTYASASRRAERTDRCPYADTPAGA
jgi:hypothetical protein